MSSPASPTQLFAQRLQTALRDAGIPDKPSALQALFNAQSTQTSISWQTARKWLQGGFIPQQDKLQVLAAALHTSPEYLRFGASTTTPADAQPQDDTASDADQAMWHNYLHSNAQARALMQHLAEFNAQLQRQACLPELAEEMLARLDDFTNTPIPADHDKGDIATNDPLRQEVFSLLAQINKQIDHLKERKDRLQQATAALRETANATPAPTPARLFAQRLHIAMRDAGIPDKPSALQAHFNEHHKSAPISWQTARNWLQGEFIPQPNKLKPLAEALNISPEHLMSMTGSPGSAPSQDKAVSDADHAMWHNYQHSSDQARLLMRQMIALIAQLQRRVSLPELADEVHAKLLQAREDSACCPEADLLLQEASALMQQLDEQIQTLQTQSSRLEAGMNARTAALLAVIHAEDHRTVDPLLPPQSATRHGRRGRM